MNVLGISGSPNPNGNTVYALRHALSILQQESFSTRLISLAGKQIGACIGCWNCSIDRKCCFEDDMTEIYAALRWCDGLILASPVYFGMVSGPLKMMMDRCVALRPAYDAPMELSGKIGAGIACGNFRNGGQELTLQNIQTFLLQQNMQVINDGPGYSHSGATIVAETQNDALGLKTVENLARNLAVVLRRQNH